jgi:hypothetical protein
MTAIGPFVWTGGALQAEASESGLNLTHHS